MNPLFAKPLSCQCLGRPDQFPAGNHLGVCSTPAGRSFLFQEPLIGYNKAYLCRPELFEAYVSQIDELRAFLKSLGTPAHIARTSNTSEYRAFLVRPETPNVEEYYGGVDIPIYSVLKKKML